jgi:iron-sulfur cluster insertion protein
MPDDMVMLNPVEGAPLSMSESAAKRIAFLAEQENDPNLMLRVTVSGGGCAGFSYGFAFDSECNEGDVLIERLGVKMVTDATSLMYLAGSEIDYVEDMIGAAFSIKNPNATSSCSCGSSFSVG